MKFIKLCVFGILLFISVSLYAGIVNTKHNLSVSNTAGTVKATSETEICIFCHTPHAAEQAGAPLWNRSMPVSAYIMYDSDYLNRTGYTTPTALGSATGEPGTISRQCLSCHDGTIALGAISNLPGSDSNSGTLNMTGVAGDGTMLNSSSAFIGTTLTNHHPVAIQYNLPMTMPTPGGGHSSESLRGNELKGPNPDSPIVLRSYLGYTGQYVECISCHDPHKENGKFLRVDTGSTHGQNIAGTCMSCHEKDNFVGSTHDVPPSDLAAYTDTTVNNKFSAGASTKVSDMKCVNCHTPHNAGADQYLTRKIQEQTCFQGASETVSTAPCHGSSPASGGKDIETAMKRQYGHGYTLLNSNGNTNHTNLDYIYGSGIAKDAGPSSGVSWNDSQHVECMDCHNQHQVRPIERTLSTAWYPANGGGTNLIEPTGKSGPLKGASGVSPTNYRLNAFASWVQPDTFTTLETATYEYEVCFKCHSYWGIGADGANGDTMTNSPAHSAYVTFSDVNLQFTDVAWEFNVNNRSAHPVVMNSNASAGTDALIDSQMKDPWKSEGTQTMYCSDCHGTDNEPGSDPKGPHGSSYKFMLKGVGKYWPTNDSTQDATHASGKHYRVGQGYTDADRVGLFCQNCHNINVSKSTKQPAPHMVQKEMQGLYCVRCHVAIPHGSPLSRLQGYSSFPAPYNYTGNMLLMTRYNKSDDYQDSSIFADVSNIPEAALDGNCNSKHRAGSGESAPTGW